MHRKIRENGPTWFYMFILIPITLVLFNLLMLKEAISIKQSYEYSSFHGVIVSKKEIADLNMLCVYFDNNKEKSINVDQITFNKAKLDDKMSFNLQRVELMDEADVEGQNFSMIIMLMLLIADASLAIKLFDYLVRGLISIYDTKRDNKTLLAFERNKSSFG